jgi:two-component system sensor histidine kinase CreC
VIAAALAAAADAVLVTFVAVKLARSRRRGASLRVRIFGALAVSALLGALITGLYAVAEDGKTIGFAARLWSVAPKAFVLASALLPVAALGAALVGVKLARPVEALAEAAGRIAEGERSARLPRVNDRDERRIAGALATLRREVENQPYATAFLRDACHDLKTPLAAIRATVELLEDGALSDPAAARRFLGNLSRAAGELDRTLGDLLMLARLETSALGDERSASLGAIVTRAIARVQPLAATRGVSVDADRALEPGPVLRCNAPALERALGNLLQNAVDATPGGQVRVSLDDGGRTGVVLDVVNEPASIPRAIRSRLFERAVTSREGRGSGLGLAIARAAVEVHGGRIYFVEMGPPRVRVRVELPA